MMNISYRNKIYFVKNNFIDNQKQSSLAIISKFVFIYVFLSELSEISS